MTVPHGDINFKSALKEADAETIQKVLDNLPEAKRAMLESRLRNLSKNASGELSERRKNLEAKGCKIFKSLQNPPGPLTWNAKININGQPTSFDGFSKLEDLLDLLEAQLEIRTTLPPAEIELDLDQLVESTLETQQRRQARLQKDKEKFEVGLESLGNSIIETRGVLSPIIVRPRKDLAHRVKGREVFEIIVGWRRWKASKHKNLKKIRGFVQDLTDTQILQWQYDENHERHENHPLDDAYFFHHLIEKENYSEEKLADRFNKKEAEVKDLLALNNLIPEAAKEFEDGHLPFKHAAFLGKFFAAEAQKQIVEEAYAYNYNQIQYGAVSFKVFKEEISEHIVRKLADAPFDTDNPDLHESAKGLKCADCAERSGFNTLFKEIAEDDSCLNKNCFEFKTKVHLKIQRERIAAQMPNPEHKSIEELVKIVPLVTERKYTDDRTFREKPRTNQNLLEKPECSFSVLSLAVDGARKGQKVYICENKECEIHHSAPPTEPEPGANDEATLKQKESEFERKVSHEVRTKVFEKAIGFFDDYTVFWQFDDLVRALIASYLETIRHTADDIIFLIRDWKNAPKNFRDPDWIEKFVATLDKCQQSQLLFLLAHKEELYSQLNSDGEKIKKITTDYTKLDFRIVDAETRLELAPDEFKPQAENHLKTLREGLTSEIPRFWTALDEEVKTDGRL